METSGYSKLQQRAWRENVLLTVLIELTYRCNLDCVFCYNDRSLKGRPLSLPDYQKLLDDLAEMGVLTITLSGGEPLANPDFFAIGAHARSLGFVIRIKSNGHALNRARLERIRDEIDPYLIELSLHGATAAIHDRQTQVRGSFEQLCANMETMASLGLRFKLNSVLTRWNEDELEAMFSLADKFNVRLNTDPQVTPRDDGDRSPLRLQASPAAVRELFEIQGRRAVDTGSNNLRDADTLVVEPPVADRPGPKKHCGSGASTATIDPYGNVFPCTQWRRKVGDLHESGIVEIWRESPGLAAIRSENEDVNRVLAALGDDAAGAGFCPGLAEELTGNAADPHPDFLERLKIRRGMDERG